MPIIDKKGLTERINIAFQDSGYNQAEFSRRANVSEATISRWLSGEIKNINETKRKEIAQSLHVSYEWLESGAGDMKTSNNSKSTSANVHIPFYKKVKPAAGGGRIIVEDDEADKVYVGLPRNYITQNLHAKPSEIVIMEIWNDSMEPIIRSGDVVFITQETKPIRDGDIYIIRMGENLLCKYIQVLPNDQLRIFSENDRYKDFEIQLGNQSQENFEIYGRIVGHLHSKF